MIAYYNGEFLDKTRIHISPDDRGFLFADGVYEVIRSYKGVLFQREEHLRRLEHGLASLRIHPVDITEIEGAAQRVLLDNRLGDATVYVQVTRGSAPRSHQFPMAVTRPTIYLDAKAFQRQEDFQAKGAMAMLVPDQRGARCDLKTIGLLANVLACQRAHEQGVFEALLVRDGAVLEGSHTNVFFVRDNVLITAPLSNYILAGVTRKVVLELAGALRMPIDLRPCFEQELTAFQEIFLVGTSVEIIPVISIDGRPVGQGIPGSHTRRLQEHFQQLTRKAR